MPQIRVTELSRPDRTAELLALEEAEQRKLNELLESVAGMLGANLQPVIDRVTLAQLQEVRDMLQAWLNGDSALTHEQVLSAVVALSERLSIDPALLADRSEMTMH